MYKDFICLSEVDCFILSDIVFNIDDL